MDSNLTEVELRHMRKTISRLEKNVRFWPWFRWLFLIMAFALLTSTYFSMSRMEDVREVYTSLSDVSLEHGKAISLINKMVEARTELMRTELELSFSVMFSALMAGAILGTAIGQWNRHSRDVAQAAILRFIIEERKGPPNKSLNAETGSAGSG